MSGSVSLLSFVEKEKELIHFPPSLLRSYDPDRPSMWLPIIMLAWGGVMIGMGFVKSFEGLLVTRVFLGITEAGTCPIFSLVLHFLAFHHPDDFLIALLRS